MATFSLFRDSPTNTTLTDIGGNVKYEVSTPLSLRGGTTTIKRNGQVLAIIKWGAFGKSEFTMNGITTPLNALFPQVRPLSRSRVFTTNDEGLKWKDGWKLNCVSIGDGRPLATYHRRLFTAMRNKKSTLDVSSDATHLTDILVVMWVIAEKLARDRRSAGGG